ncbi:MAG: TetR/AcrR family transcriptional regulator [Sedimentisphaeraceae bacterium JB056]
MYASSEKTRDDLIDAAGELAAEIGFPNVSTRAIAKRANANIGSIHYHFGGKNALFEAVVKSVMIFRDRFSVKDAIAPFLDVLDTPEGQANAVRAVIKRNVRVTFDKKRPWWHMRVVYQVFQFKCGLQNVLDSMVQDEENAVIELISRIKPDLTQQQYVLRFLVMSTPVFFQADYYETILERLESDEFSEEYLRDMEDILTRQTQFILGLPVDELDK